MKEVILELYSNTLVESDVHVYVYDAYDNDSILDSMTVRVQTEHTRLDLQTILRCVMEASHGLVNVSLNDFSKRILPEFLASYKVKKVLCYSRQESFIVSDFSKKNNIPIERYFDSLMRHNDIKAQNTLPVDLLSKMLNVNTLGNLQANRHLLYNTPYKKLDTITVNTITKYFKHSENMERLRRSTGEFSPTLEMSNWLSSEAIKNEIESLTPLFVAKVLDGSEDIDLCLGVSHYTRILLKLLSIKVKDKEELSKLFKEYLYDGLTLMEIVTDVLEVSEDDLGAMLHIDTKRNKSNRDLIRPYSPALFMAVEEYWGKDYKIVDNLEELKKVFKVYNERHTIRQKRLDYKVLD